MSVVHYETPQFVFFPLFSLFLFSFFASFCLIPNWHFFGELVCNSPLFLWTVLTSPHSSIHIPGGCNASVFEPSPTYASKQSISTLYCHAATDNFTTSCFILILTVLFLTLLFCSSINSVCDCLISRLSCCSHPLTFCSSAFWELLIPHTMSKNFRLADFFIRRACQIII